jgi:hypothetical protein
MWISELDVRHATHSRSSHPSVTLSDMLLDTKFSVGGSALYVKYDKIKAMNSPRSNDRIRKHP